MTTLKEKEAELEELAKKLKKVRNSLKYDPELSKLYEEKKQVAKELEQVRKDEDKASKKIFYEFTINGNYPWFSRNSAYLDSTDTNIKDCILKAIKEQVGAISKLRGSDIKDIVGKLIQLERSNHPTYNELFERRKELSQKESDLFQKICKLEDAILQPIRNAVGLIREELQQLRAQTGGTYEQKRSKLLSFRANACSDETVAKIYEDIRSRRTSPYKPLV